ncbi:MAG TPA: dihydroneopterin aldolase, partial [Candidatus Lustribacter sp.]|nr:dihydroneopterin aldolase [Candidatus Lustribacter sp.]
MDRHRDGPDEVTTHHVGGDLLGVRGYGYHGVLADEKERGQEFLVDVVLELSTRAAGLTDDLSLTVSYAEVADQVVTRIAGPSVDLIETLAEQVATDVLGRDLVRAVTVTVHKPQAPVGHPFGDVQVSIRRERAVPVVVALGANLGDARATLVGAVRDLGALDGLSRLAVSDLVETDPVGGAGQPFYLNAVAAAVTSLGPGPLLAALHEIEARHGRVRDVRWGARTLDLDLVQYGRPGERDEVIRN